MSSPKFTIVDEDTLNPTIKITNVKYNPKKHGSKKEFKEWCDMQCLEYMIQNYIVLNVPGGHKLIPHSLIHNK